MTNNEFYKKLTFAIIIIGIILRFGLASIYHVAGDACWHLSASRFIAENKTFPLFEQFGRNEPFWAPPFFHLMAAFLYSIFSVLGDKFAEFGVKMLSPLFGSLTLIFVYLINKKLFNEKITFYSMLFTTFIPMMIDYNVFSYIDGTVTFFIVLSIYFALNDKYIKSAIAAGLAAVTKYHGIFVLPLLIYIIYKNSSDKKSLYKKIFFIFLIPILISLPWFIRNYVNLGNPLWPFLNFIFNGLDTQAFESANLQTFSISNTLHINSLIFTYFALFGVPDGNYTNFLFFDIPYLSLLFALWLLGTLFFMLPFSRSLNVKDKKAKNMLIFWIILFLAVLILYIGNSGWTAGRFLLPAIPALGMFYGIGVNNFNFKSNVLKRLFFIFLYLTLIGLVSAEIIKIKLAADKWNSYNDDFEWIKINTEKSALIIPGGQCLAYNVDRTTLTQKSENLEKSDYVWVNKKFFLEGRSIIKDEMLKETETNNYPLVYENKKTGTIIYKTKR